MKLSDAIQEYQRSREAQGYARNTVRASGQALDLLLSEVGNIQVKHLDARHGEAFIAAMLGRGMKPGTINLYRGAFSRFCKWAHQRRLLPGASNPTATTRNMIDPKAPRRRVQAVDFPRLLDCCEHPQDRIIVALGLYLFLRASEISHLDIEHVNLAVGEVTVYQPKTKRYDVMPICEELDTELRRWLTWYAHDQSQRGPLLPSWPLVPARRVSQLWGDLPPGVEPFGQMNPPRRSTQIHNKVKKALVEFGWEVEAEHREGVHTLRRSGARALFDEMVESGRVRDGALRVVQAFLHHKSVAMTEHYLGLEADLERRNKMFAGVAMFPKPETNVVPLEVAR